MENHYALKSGIDFCILSIKDIVENGRFKPQGYTGWPTKNSLD